MKNLKRCTAILWAAVILAFSFASCKAESDDGGEKNSASYTVTVTNGIATPSSAESGATVTIKANDPADGKTFDKWTTTTEGVTFASETSAETTFVMPAKDVEVTATYKDASASGGETYSATIATAPAVATGDIEEGSETALISAGTASCGTMMYAVTTENTKPTSTEGFSATVPTAKERSAGTYYVWYYVKADDGYTDSAISEEAVTVTIVAAAPSAYTITVTGGKATSTLEPGVPAITSAEPGDTVYVKFTGANINLFDKWEASEGVTLEDPTSAVTSFTMIASNVTITAKSKTTYTVTVVNGSTGNSEATAGDTVYISASSPASGKKFDKWVSDSEVTFGNASSSSTYFTMIAENVTVTATYKDAVATIKDRPNAIGDVVFGDGTACSADDAAYLTESQRGNVSGVVFKIDLESKKAWITELSESTTYAGDGWEGKYEWAVESKVDESVSTSDDDGDYNATLFNDTYGMFFGNDFPAAGYPETISTCYDIDTELTSWYLPSKDELNQLILYMTLVNYALDNVGSGTQTPITKIGSDWYWSSSQGTSDGTAWRVKAGSTACYSKAAKLSCRAVKIVPTE